MGGVITSAKSASAFLVTIIIWCFLVFWDCLGNCSDPFPWIEKGTEQSLFFSSMLLLGSHLVKAGGCDFGLFKCGVWFEEWCTRPLAVIWHRELWLLLWLGDYSHVHETWCSFSFFALFRRNLQWKDICFSNVDNRKWTGMSWSLLIKNTQKWSVVGVAIQWSIP